MTILSNEQFEAAVRSLAKTRSNQRSAWDQVIVAARKYAQMKSFGSYDDGEHRVTVHPSDRKNHEDNFKELLLLEVMRAYREDAVTGIAISQIVA